MTIQLATPQLLELAEAMRGPEWADDLAGALAAARNAGWDWPKAGRFACGLLFDGDATPRDLTEACRNPLKRGTGGDPEAYDRGAAKVRDLLAAKQAAKEPVQGGGEAA
jgi:hypothetical protein